MRFAPQLQVFYAHRSELTGDSLERVNRNPRKQLSRFDLVIPTYSLVRKLTWLTELDWGLVMLDEAQAIKNAASAQTKTVKKLPALTRIAMTGTSVKNKLGDLWSLFDFCCSGLLGSAKQFKAFVGRLAKQQGAGGSGGLWGLEQPYILRRFKTDPTIISDLPDKTEVRVVCGLVKKQAALYQAAVSDLAIQLELNIIAQGLAYILQLYLNGHLWLDRLTAPDYNPESADIFG